MKPIDLKARVAAYRKSLVLRALEASQGDPQRASRTLGLSVRAIRHWRRKLGLPKLPSGGNRSTKSVKGN